MIKRPASEWVRNDMPDLPIVDDAIWRRVQARHAAATKAGANVREGMKRAGQRPGRNPAYLFSSLLKCGVCGANLTIIGGTGKFKSYGCASRKEGGTHVCSNGPTVRLSIVEARSLERRKIDLVDRGTAQARR